MAVFVETNKILAAFWLYYRNENAWIKNLLWEIAFVGKHKNCIGLCMCKECAIYNGYELGTYM